MITTWGHDPGIVPVSNVLLALNDALSHSAVLVQVSSHCIGMFKIWRGFPMTIPSRLS